MSKMPSFQFYPGDWRKDPNLSRASLQAKGAMIEIMCLAFECEKRGVLKTGGKAWTIDEIAMAIGGNIEVNKGAVQELIDKKILKKDRKGAIFSQRMCNDEKLRKVRQAAGSRGGNPILLNHKVNQTANQNLTPSSSSSSSIKEIYKENAELVGLEITNSIEYCDRTFQRKYSISEIQNLWKGFLINGENSYYPNRHEKVKHFRNWIKLQPYKQNLETNYLSGPPLKIENA